MNSTLIDVARTQIWQVPFLLLYVAGLLLSLSRRDLGRAQSFAMIGFGALIVSVLLQFAQMYQALSGGDYHVTGPRTVFFTLIITIVKLSGFALVMTALFIDRGKKTDTSHPAGIT